MRYNTRIKWVNQLFVENVICCMQPYWKKTCGGRYFCEELKVVGYISGIYSRNISLSWKISFVLDAFDIMTVQLEKPAAGGLGLSIVGR